MAENAKRRNPLKGESDLPDSISPEIGYGMVKRRTFGSARGLLWISESFDEPLEDFREHMESDPEAREAIEKGLQDSNSGRVVPVDEVRVRFGLLARWKEADMHRVIEAIYEDGVLKPLEVPELQEHERVTLEIQEPSRYPESPDPMNEEELDAWFREINELTPKVSQEDVDRVDAALEEADKQEKELRRRMGFD
jgi:predicted DNA-binding antitoxin AbrB/MazE fold protein